MPGGIMDAMKRNGWSYTDIFEMRRAGWEWEERYEIVECAGCTQLTFRLVRWDEHRDRRNPKTGERLQRGETVVYFPPPVARPAPQWLSMLRPNIRLLLEQVYGALDAGLAALSAMGTRTVLDVVMREQVGDQGTFAKTLEAFCAAGHITATDKGILRPAIDAGSAGAHRGYIPTEEDTHLMVDIVERLLERLYVHPIRAAEMQKRTPQRERLAERDEKNRRSQPT